MRTRRHIKDKEKGQRESARVQSSVGTKSTVSISAFSHRHHGPTSQRHSVNPTHWPLLPPRSESRQAKAAAENCGRERRRPRRRPRAPRLPPAASSPSAPARPSPPLTPRPASRAPGSSSSSRPPLPLHLAFAAVVSGTPSQLVRVPSEVVLAD